MERKKTNDKGDRAPRSCCEQLSQQGKEFGYGKRPGPRQRDTPAGIETDSPLSKCEGKDRVPASTIQVSPAGSHFFEETGNWAEDIPLNATVHGARSDETVSDISNYHVDYARERSAFELSDLTIRAGENPPASSCPRIVVNLAQSGGLAFIRPSYVEGTELRTLWDTGAGCSYIHKEFSALGTIASKAHFVRSVFANGQAHTSNELLQISVSLGPFDLPLEKQIQINIKVIPMDLPKNFDMILGCDVMKQLQASLDIERNTIQLRHRGRIVTLVMDKHKTVETTSVNGLSSVSVTTAELTAQHPTSYSTLEEEFGPFSTTLFVSATAGLATLNYEEPVEALGQNWTELPGPILCVPPLRLLPQVTQKLRASTPMDLVLLTPYLPRSPWFRELQPLVQKGRVVPSADRAYMQQIETYGHSTPAGEMVALQINRNSTTEVTTLGAIQVNRPTVTREAVEGLQLPESLDAIQQQQLRHLLLKYLHLMQPPGDDEPPPPPSEFDHRIVLTEGGSQRVQTRPIRLAADQTIELQKRFEHRCKRGIIQRAASDSETCRSAVFMVKRKDGPDRDVVDFRALNDVTVKDHFPLPLIEELLDRLSQARFFISLDLKEAYYNIRMHPDSVRYTGTITHFGLFEWLVLVMGMCNAVATFQ
eukprot:scaffold1267_cov414-Pavlova_lutheri.AAC.1